MVDQPPALTVHELHVTLLDVVPQVWREVRVPSSITLAELHDVLQVVMGWTGVHLHQWVIGDTAYGPPDKDDWGEPMVDEIRTELATVAPAGSAFRYEYDFGDGWEHLVEVTRVSPIDDEEPRLVCLGGRRACPPEDCGGPDGYEHVLSALADPDDEEHETIVEWLGDSFDPEEFDLARLNRQLGVG